MNPVMLEQIKERTAALDELRKPPPWYLVQVDHGAFVTFHITQGKPFCYPRPTQVLGQYDYYEDACELRDFNQNRLHTAFDYMLRHDGDGSSWLGIGAVCRIKLLGGRYDWSVMYFKSAELAAQHSKSRKQFWSKHYELL